MKTMTWMMGMAFCFTAATASAQPNPFDDYENKRTDAPADVEPTTVVELEVQDVPKLKTKKGQWNAGIDSAFSWTTARNDVSGGGSAENTNLFIRITPTVGWFWYDDFEIGGALGYLSQSTARRGGGTATESDWMLAATGRYFLRMSERFAITPAVALGGYLGSTRQPVEVTTAEGTRTNEEDASTIGFIGSIEIGGAYQLSPELALRAGLAFTAVFGSQSIGATDESLGVRTMNTGLSLGLAYAW